jgi:hypothetical protein
MTDCLRKNEFLKYLDIKKRREKAYSRDLIQDLSKAVQNNIFIQDMANGLR